MSANQKKKCDPIREFREQLRKTAEHADEVVKKISDSVSAPSAAVAAR